MPGDYPDELHYTREHEWVRIEGKFATVGLTKHAVDQLGDITQVDLPREGGRVKKEEAFGTVESVKAVSDLFAPFTGVVVKVNTPLLESPETINDDPYDDGWMIQIEMSDPSEAQDLMSAADYVEFLKESE